MTAGVSLLVELLPLEGEAQRFPAMPEIANREDLG